MKSPIVNLGLMAVIASSVLLPACSTVPEEVVTLSYTVGQDIEEMHRANKALIKVYFDGLRSQVNTFVDTQWKPTFIRKFVKSGKLVEAAQMQDPNAVLERVSFWAELAVEKIEARRKSLLEPVNVQEQTLVTEVDDAYGRMVLANSTITAHLNSLREVQVAQEKVLEALNIKEYRDSINEGLVKASEITEKGIEAAAKAEGIVVKASETKAKIEAAFGRESP